MVKTRIGILAAIFGFCFLLILFRLFYLQVLHGDYYENRSERKRTRIQHLSPPRGRILAADGSILAEDRLSFDVSIVFDEFENPAQELAKLIGILDIPSRFALWKSKRGMEFTPYWSKAKQEARDLFLEEFSRLSGRDEGWLNSRIGGDYRYMEDLFCELRDFKAERGIHHLSLTLGKPIEEIEDAIEAKRQKILKLIERKWEDERAWKKPQSFILDIPEEAARWLEIHNRLVPGFVVSKTLRRQYSGGLCMGHLLGYVNQINGPELETWGGEGEKFGEFFIHRYFKSDLVGRRGLEKQYEEFLKGRRGLRTYEADSMNNFQKTLQEKEPRPGGDIRLNIKPELQKMIYEAFASRNWRGSGVIMDVESGAVYALVSYPSYDPNWFTPPSDNAEIRKLYPEKNKNIDQWNKSRYWQPALNRAVTGAYPPGSVFKIAIALAALEEEKITNGTHFNCGWGQIFPVGGKSCRHGPHGSCDLPNAICKSCNMYFYNVGRELDVDQIHDWADRFGFGRKTGIELPDEGAGLVASRAYWKSKHPNQLWWPGETINMAIGQGMVSVSPLQVARFMACVANGGRLPNPRLVAEMISNGNSEATQYSYEYIPVNERNLDVIRAGMCLVTAPGGTAGSAGLTVAAGCAVDVAAKTGTAENSGYYDPDSGQRVRELCDHAWLAGYAPADHPKIAFCFFGENVHGGGGKKVAPVAREVMDFFFAGKLGSRPEGDNDGD